MSNYTTFINALYGGGGSSSGPSITPIGVSGGGTHLSSDVPADAGDYLSFGFDTLAGREVTCDPNLGKGEGTLTKESADLFPITGDGEPRVVNVQVTASDGGNYQLGLSIPTVNALLIHSNTTNNDQTFTDSSPNNLPISNGFDPAWHSTDHAKFGTTSIYFQQNRYESISVSNAGGELTLNGVFTFDFWAYVPATDTVGVFFGTNADDEFNMSYFNSNDSFNSRVNGVILTSPIALPNLFDQWNHFAITRDASDTVRIFLNGVVQDSQTIAGVIPITGFLGFGRQRNSYSNGFYLDEIRLINEACEWDSNFTPPTNTY